MLAEIIPLLTRMSYSELKDFIDFCEFYHLAERIKPSPEKCDFRKAIRKRRVGIASGGLPFTEKDGNLIPDLMQDYKGLEMKTDGQKEALSKLVRLKNAEMFLLLGAAKTTRQTSGAIAWALLREKEPIRRLARGNIQVKWIDTRTIVIKDKEGNIIDKKTEKEPYLYFRYSTVQGNTDRKETRYKSLYIHPEEKSKKQGYPYAALAAYFDDLIKEHGIPKQWTNPKTGEIKTNKVRPAGDDNPIAQLERRIMSYVKLEGDKLEIDHEKLLELQNELCGNV